MKLVPLDHPALRKTAEDIHPDQFVHYAQLLKASAKRLNDLVGLALPQLGISKRGFVLLPSAHICNPVRWQFIFNPVIRFPSEANPDQSNVTDDEGCLSIQGGDEKYEVTRPNNIQVEYSDESGRRHLAVNLSGFPARVFQHEYDHLRGILISDIGKPIDWEARRKQRADELAKKPHGGFPAGMALAAASLGAAAICSLPGKRR